MISQKQKAILHIAKKQLALSDEEYHDLLDNITGGRACSSSATSFYNGDFKAAMKVMQNLGFNRGLKMSQAQYTFILKLRKKLGWAGQPARLRGYSKRILGFEDWQKADRRQAAALIQALIKLEQYGHEDETNKRKRTQIPAPR